MTLQPADPEEAAEPQAADRVATWQLAGPLEAAVDQGAIRVVTWKLAGSLEVPWSQIAAPVGNPTGEQRPSRRS